MSTIAQLMDRSFPKEMTKVPLWLIYKLVDRGDGKFAKPPVSPLSGEICSKTDEGKYTDFDRALMGVEQHNADGVGFVFLHGFIAIDLDDCFKENGELNELAQDIFDHFSATYSEFSPSGNGIHIFCQGEKPNDKTRVPGIEVYTGHNFVTVTGDKIPESGDKVLNMQDSLDWLFDKYLPAPVSIKPDVIMIEHGEKSSAEWLDIGLTHDDKLSRLYRDTEHDDDESGHDMALMCKLAYWLNRDSDAMLEAFFESPWVHSKDKRHLDKVDKRSDYMERTLDKAILMASVTAYENERKLKNTSSVAMRISETQDGEIILPMNDYTDVGNARAFSEMFSEQLAYTREWGWCYFTGFNWETGQEYQAQQYAVEFAENVMYVAKEYYSLKSAECAENGCTPESTKGKVIMAHANAVMKYANRTNSDSGIRALLNLAQGMMLLPASAFDHNAWLLTTPNVIVDLRTGETCPPSWNHYTTMTTNITYDSEAKNTGMWDDFLDQIFCKDKDLIDYVQLMFGASCVGKVYEENLIIATGTGSNGKSTLFNVFKAILGNYCISVNPDILMTKTSYEQQVSIASIRGKRLVIGQETESGQELSTASVKRMVSTDAMVGRVLNQGYIEFEPTHSTMLATNHLPKVKDNDAGTWRRLTVLPFNATISRKEMITNFQDIVLGEDGAYILKWLVDGAIKFYNLGCTFGEKPAAVLEASNSYRDVQRNYMERFLEECVQIVDPMKHPCVWTNSNDVYEAYEAWCTSNNILKPASKITLSKALVSRGMSVKSDRINGKQVRKWRYILLNNEDGTPAIAVEG